MNVPVVLTVRKHATQTDLSGLSPLFDWYRMNLCAHELVDPRGLRVRFLDTDFVHLIRLVDKYGKEPRNARMTLEQIQSGRIPFRPERMSIQRAQELPWARFLITEPDRIVVNWQPLGRANPGDAYIKISRHPRRSLCIAF